MLIKNAHRKMMLLLLMLSIAMFFGLPIWGNNEVKANMLLANNEKVVTQSAIMAIPKEKTKVSKKVTKKNTKIEKKYLYSLGYIRVREKASFKSSEKFLIKLGQRVQVIKENSNWVKIKIKNKTGYVFKKYLTKNRKKISFSKRKAKSFRLTGYCSCYKCSEGWGRQTLSGRRAKANHTIAADLSVFPLYTEVYIEGMGKYTVEDKGGGVRGKHLDVFVNAHSQCFNIKSRAKVFEIKG